MLSKIVKWTAIAALVAGVFTRSAIGVAIILQLAVVVAAVIVLAQAANLHRYVWVGPFLVLSPVSSILFSQFHSRTSFLGLPVLPRHCSS